MNGNRGDYLSGKPQIKTVAKFPAGLVQALYNYHRIGSEVINIVKIITISDLVIRPEGSIIGLLKGPQNGLSRGWNLRSQAGF